MVTTLIALSLAIPPVTRSASFTLGSPIQDVFPLFTPDGERRWAKGWNPQAVWPSDLSATNNAVFTTTHPDGSQGVWVITEYKPPTRLSYVRVVPHHHTATISIQCNRSGQDETRVNVTYTFVALGENGEDYVKAQTSESYSKTMHEWRRRLTDALSLKPKPLQ